MLFAGFLGLGAVAIFLNLGLPWIPALSVLLYGCVLLYCALRYRVPHAEATNNSPYFLGFIFFLLSLFRTFYWATFQHNNDTDSIIRQLGSSLLTTIVGLVARQVLFSVSPTQADEDLFFRTLEEELRRSATAFRKSQAEMVELIQEFVTAKRTIFAEEQMAARHYIKTLTKATAMFDDSIGSLPTAVTGTIESCMAKFNELTAQLQRFSVATATVDGSALQVSLDSFRGIAVTAKELQESVASLRTSMFEVNDLARSLPNGLNTQMASLTEELALVPTAAKEQIVRIEKDINDIDSLLTAFVNLLRGRVEAFK